MKSVILNMMMLGIVGGLIGGEASAAFFRKAKAKTLQVQDEASEGTVKKAVRKTKESVKSAAKKVKKSVSDALDKDKRREKTRQKALAKEESPMNTMFESKAEIEYNMQYLNDVRKNFKSTASTVEKASSQVENAFVIKSLLFETASYIKLFDKFSEQYIEGMNKLKKAKQYEDSTYELAMNAFKNAHDIINYAKTQHGVVTYLRDLITQENLKNISGNEATNLSKKLKKLSESLNQTSDDMKKLKKIISTINEQTVYEEGNFKFLATGMLSCLKKATDTSKEISTMSEETSKTVQNYIDSLEENDDTDTSSAKLKKSSKTVRNHVDSQEETDDDKQFVDSGFYESDEE